MHDPVSTMNARAEDRHPRMEWLASHVYGFLQLGGARPSNAGLVLGDPVILIDGMADEVSNLVFDDMLAAVSPGPPAYLIWTHRRGASPRGKASGSNATVISAGHPGFLPSRAPDAPWTELNIPAGSVTVRVLDPAPVLGDCSSLCAWVPEARVLFTGDLLSPQITPGLSGGNGASYLKLLRHLTGLRPNVLVPARGPVTSAAPIAAHAEHVRSLLR